MTTHSPTNTAHIDLFIDGVWEPAAELRLRRGEQRNQPTSFEYDLDYALEHAGAADRQATSARLPVDFPPHELPGFPAFCVDLMPQGEGRRRLERALKEQGLPQTDWWVLLRGAGSPTGNLRVRSAAHEVDPDAVGVPREEVVTRGDAFLDWAEAQRINLRGSTDTTGASPKLLLVEDEQGLLHADGVLPDARARRHWLVKFPRGATTRDHQVLASEAAYLEVARRVGLRCGAPLRFEERALFIPRFDREVRKDGVQRWGMESLYSVMGVVQSGAPLAWEAVCAAVAELVEDPEAELRELVLRDALAVALGDTDNHGRNTALLKTEAGVKLSPLYDFAPMAFDPQGISRLTRWRGELTASGLQWAQVVEAVAPWVPVEAMTSALLELARRLPEVEGWLRELDVPGPVIELVRPRIARTHAALLALEA